MNGFDDLSKFFWGKLESFPCENLNKSKSTTKEFLPGYVHPNRIKVKLMRSHINSYINFTCTLHVIPAAKVTPIS